MAGMDVGQQGALLTVNGTANGVVTLASVYGYYKDARVWLSSSTQPSIECTIVLVSGLTLTLRAVSATGMYARQTVDASLYTVAQSARVDMPAQYVASALPLSVGDLFLFDGTTITPKYSMLDSAGPLILGAGTLANCALQGPSDPNTGLMFPAGDTLNVVTGGVLRMQIGSTGTTTFTGGVTFPTNTLITVGGSTSFYENPAGTLNFAGIVTFNNDIFMAVNKVLRFNVGGTTYIFDDGSDVQLGGAHLRINTGLKLGTNLIFNSTAPTVAAGAGASVTANNGNIAFDINLGGAAQTGTITLPAATTGWVCTMQDVTTPASFVFVQTGGTQSTVTFTCYSRTTGLAINWNANDHIRCTAVAY